MKKLGKISSIMFTLMLIANSSFASTEIEEGGTLGAGKMALLVLMVLAAGLVLFLGYKMDNAANDPDYKKQKNSKKKKSKKADEYTEQEESQIFENENKNDIPYEVEENDYYEQDDVETSSLMENQEYEADDISLFDSQDDITSSFDNDVDDDLSFEEEEKAVSNSYETSDLDSDFGEFEETPKANNSFDSTMVFNSKELKEENEFDSFGVDAVEVVDEDEIEEIEEFEEIVEVDEEDEYESEAIDIDLSRLDDDEVEVAPRQKVDFFADAMQNIEIINEDDEYEEVEIEDEDEYESEAVEGLDAKINSLDELDNIELVSGGNQDADSFMKELKRYEEEAENDDFVGFSTSSAKKEEPAKEESKTVKRYTKKKEIEEMSDFSLPNETVKVVDIEEPVVEEPVVTSTDNFSMDFLAAMESNMKKDQEVRMEKKKKGPSVKTEESRKAEPKKTAAKTTTRKTTKKKEE